MFWGKLRPAGGFTLIELTASVGVFMVVMGCTAQVLVSYFATLDVTHQRTEALQNAVGVINQMRALRDTHPNDFPAILLTTWPQGHTLSDEADTPPVERVTSLPGEKIVITYIDAEGHPIDAEELRAVNPVRVMVTSHWRTLRGGAMAQASIQTLLAAN